MTSDETPTGEATPECWVVGYDGSEHARIALDWAATRAAERGAIIDVVSSWMYPHDDTLPPMGEDDEGWDGEEFIYSVDQIAERFGVDARRRAVMGPATVVLLDAVEDAALAVVGNRGRGGFARLLLGSVSQNLVNRSDRPTIVVPETADLAPLERMVIGVDRSPGSMAALRWAHEFAPADCTLEAVHVWEGLRGVGLRIDDESATRLRESAEEDLEHRIAKLEADLGVPGRFTRVLEDGHAGRTLVARGAGAGLVVVGSRGASGEEAPMIGSAAMWIVHHLPCPTAVIPRPMPG